jgi:hypothetical protein
MVRGRILVSVVVSSLLSVSALSGCGGASAVEEANPDSVMMVGMVLLDGHAMVSEDALSVAMERYTGGMGPTLAPLVSGDETGEMIMQLGSERVYLIPVPAPIPDGEADAYATNSLAYLLYEWQLPAHTEHMIVAVSSPVQASHLQALNEFTDVLAAVVETTSAVGVYIPDMSVTHDPSFIMELAADPEPGAALPMLSGVSVAQPTPETISFLSLGMAVLGLPDLMLDSPADVAGESLIFFTDLLVYVTLLGAPIPEGETVGRGDVERLPVTYQPSPINPDASVWTVVVP